MGPTASGKTALALEWAQRLGGEIVSVDSALVYRGLDIGAAKPDAAERGAGAAPPDRPARTVAAVFGRRVRRRCARGHRRHRRARQAADPRRRHRPVFPRAAARPVADARSRPGDCARSIEAEAGERGWAALHAELRRDRSRSRRRASTPPIAQRIQRALEVYRVSGRTISDWQARGRRAPRLPLRVLKLVLAPRDRAVLHARIEQRFDAMLAAGFLDEVRAPARAAGTAGASAGRWICRRCARSAIARPGSTSTARPTPAEFRDRAHLRHAPARQAPAHLAARRTRRALVRSGDRAPRACEQALAMFLATPDPPAAADRAASGTTPWATALNGTRFPPHGRAGCATIGPSPRRGSCRRCGPDECPYRPPMTRRQQQDQMGNYQCPRGNLCRIHS